MISRYLLIVLTILAVPSSGQATAGLLPDLVFDFSCKNIAADSLAGDFVGFLRISGFRSIDLASIQAERGLGRKHRLRLW